MTAQIIDIISNPTKAKAACRIAEFVAAVEEINGGDGDDAYPLEFWDEFSEVMIKQKYSDHFETFGRFLQTNPYESRLTCLKTFLADLFNYSSEEENTEELQGYFTDRLSNFAFNVIPLVMLPEEGIEEPVITKRPAIKAPQRVAR